MTHDDEDVRQLLEDAVSDVEPRGGLDVIRDRTTTTAHRRPGGWGTVAAVVAAAAAVTAVVGFVGLPGTHPAGPVSQVRPTSLAPVYFLGSTGVGPRLFREDRPGPSGDGGTEHALQLAVSGQALDPDYRSMWPAGTRVGPVTTSAGRLVVHLDGTDLARRPEGVTPAQARMSVQQLVYTARAGRPDSQARVGFEVAGSPVRSLLGVPVGSVAAGSPDRTLAPVSITSPSSPSDKRITVTSPVTVSGRAAAVEANVQWELLRDGTVVRRGFTTAGACCTLSPYTFTVRAAPGDYTLVVHDEDPSGAGATSADSKLLHVR